jgi:hypothetical protein
MSRVLTLTEQLEFRDVNCPVAEEYWKIRGRCQHEGLSCLGTREELIRRYELYCFCSENTVTRLSTEDLEKTSDTPLEKFAHPSWVTGSVLVSNDSFAPLTTRYPWKVVPEVSYMNKKLASDDVFKAIGSLMRPTFCFYNHIAQPRLTDRLVALSFLPFTPDLLTIASDSLVRVLASALGLNSKTEPKELGQLLDKQKLLEVYYTVCDSEALHGVGYCQTHFSTCKNPASGLCSNFMCSLCCSLHQFRLPCTIHDLPLQFFRHRLKSLIEFEQQFDRLLTLRLTLKEPLRKIQLYRVFEGFAVRWNNTQVWHHPSTARIQHVYLTFLTPEDAKNAYLSRKSLLKSTELKFVIETLPETLESVYKRMKQFEVNPSKVIVIYETPAGKYRNHLPPKNQVIPEMVSLASAVTGLPENAIRAEAAVNPISGNFSVREFYLEFPTAEACQMFFAEQPYFQFFIAHKLSHLIVCPFVKPNNMCLVCPRPKECLHDLCAECCGKFSQSPLHCCSTHSAKYNLIAYQPLQNRRMLELSPSTIVRKIPEKVAKFHITVRHMLEEGVYTWFRPRFYLKADGMRTANQELQVVLDNNLVRSNTASGSMSRREGKIFNFASSPPVVTQLDGKQVTEAMDCHGRIFLEYAYPPVAEADISHNYAKPNLQANVYTRQDYISDTSHVGFSIKNSFHFFLAGLNPYVKGLKEIVIKEVKSKLGKVLPDEFILIDKNSLTANMLLLDVTAEANIDSYNRVAGVKMQNETDALKLVLGEVGLVLPLSNGHYGCPIVIPSAELCQYIHNQYEECMRNPSHFVPAETNAEKTSFMKKKEKNNR